MEKKCNMCDTVKDITDFYKNQTRCKSCTKQYAIDNKDKIKSYQKSYREDNSELIKEVNKKYYQSNKEPIRQKQKEYYIENNEEILKIQKNYRNNNKEKLSIKNPEYSRKYYQKNKNNILFILTKGCRTMIGNSIRGYGFTKSSRTSDILGCSYEEFKIHIESLFEPWMDWNNWGLYNGDLNYGWDIDHIIPISSAKTEEDIIKLNHYTNLRPLCSFNNRYIKMNKLED